MEANQVVVDLAMATCKANQQPKMDPRHAMTKGPATRALAKRILFCCSVVEPWVWSLVSTLLVVVVGGEEEEEDPKSSKVREPGRIQDQQKS